MPTLETLLPIPLWRQFTEHFSRAAGVSLIPLTAGGLVLGADGDDGNGPCRDEDSARCAGFYRKISDQVLQGEDPLLFRCPGERLIFAVPIHLREGGTRERFVIAGRPAEGDGRRGTPNPQELLGLARLAQVSLVAASEGYHLRELGLQRDARIRTLFEVSADLARASSAHELHALAINTVGVIFDISSVALLLADASVEGFRVHSALGPLERPLRTWVLPRAGSPFEPSSSRAPRSLQIDDPVALRRIGLPEEAERLIAFPLRSDSELHGVLALFNSELSREDEQLVLGFSAQLATLMENRRLKQELLRRAEEMETFQKIGGALQTCLDPDALFPVILGEACNLTGAQKGSLMVARNGARELLVRAARGIHERIVGKLRVRSGEGVAGNVFATGEPVVVENVEADLRFRRKNRPHYQTKSFVSFPILHGEQVIGVLNLSDKVSGDPFAEEDLRRLRAMTSQAVMAIERSSYFLQNRELRKISITDPLTGLLNRRYLQERLAEEVDRAKRHGHSLSLIMVDIDHFKAYNDANGHPAGDKALVLVGRSLRGSVRAIDVVSRFGGEEFAVILPETRPEEARDIAERIRKEVESFYFPGEESVPGGRLTVSLGFAGFPQDATDLKSLIQRADQALYSAKDQGRNRAVGATPLAQEEGTWTTVL